MLTKLGPPKKKIFNAIRKTFTQSELAKAARRVYLCDEVGPKNGIRYRCNRCSYPFPPVATALDHIEPVIPLSSSEAEMDYNEYVDRVYCDISNLQILCKPCHKVKTDRENLIRKAMRKVKSIQEQFPPGTDLEDVIHLFEAFEPKMIDGVKGEKIGHIGRVAINWYLKMKKKEGYHWVKG